jgi:hypothetical protein
MEFFKFVFDWPWKHYGGCGWNEILSDIATIHDVPHPHIMWPLNATLLLIKHQNN